MIKIYQKHRVYIHIYIINEVILSYMSFRTHSLATPPLPSSRNNCDSPEINFEQHKPKFWAGLLQVLSFVWEW